MDVFNQVLLDSVLPRKEQKIMAPSGARLPDNGFLSHWLCDFVPISLAPIVRAKCHD